ncbi:MAG: helix-turn-helix domain-containing protein [Proteobacteria bacterium]|nr:helix-turn-helix domain-containing protein [Pseudomonadota bacterium]HQR04531.1 DUF4115 domain-containing protein [Rhodocyclaceae bacterium]
MNDVAAIADTAEAAPVSRQLPGAILRQKREHQGLGVAEVAQMLKFSPRQVEALEQDDYDTLTGAAFVRGFIRAYAKVLKCEAGPLLALLDTAAPQPVAEIMAPVNMGEATPESFLTRHQKGLIAGMVIITMIVGALLWLVESDAPHADHTDQAARSGANETVMPPDPVATVSSSTPAEAVAPAAAPSEMPPPSQSPIPPAGTVASTVPVPATNVADAAPTPAPSSPASVMPAVSAPILQVDFSGRSWLEVKDASGRVVLTGEFPADSRQTVPGRPPFQIWIGKASAVRILYNQKPVDLQPYTRDEVARLTLE